MFSHIVLAWDESNAARHAADYAFVLAEKFGSRIDIVSVPALEENAALALTLEALRIEAERRGLQTTRVVVMPADVKPESAIVKHAYDSGADVIVIGHRPLDPLERFIVGSVSERVVRAAPCAVLSVAGSE
ncbi:universal stress protein [Vulcanimicrobium alpinum]|uniref:Universal stress protein n=1 Tax=Vulcanimicrobium alpinum TaxID=3016050 RepID=A0AAN2CBH5_UNVUL|nr:universal stress protein [Vulcanimicrobium alpinum]BDE08246.1 universal stress protein [Vulcanimicrobium alpinum]